VRRTMARRQAPETKSETAIPSFTGALGKADTHSTLGESGHSATAGRPPDRGGAPGYLREELAISRCFFGYPEVGKSGGKSANSVMQLGKSSNMEERALGPP
jgi:hypothetical protein